MTTYTARLKHESDGRWSVAVEEEPRVHTWGKTIDQALTRLSEAAASWFQTDEAAVALTSHGISMRDAAILGISHQRVHQLLTPNTTPGRKAGWLPASLPRTHGTR